MYIQNKTKTCFGAVTVQRGEKKLCGPHIYKYVMLNDITFVCCIVPG
jgi:hypothetical protein